MTSSSISCRHYQIIIVVVVVVVIIIRISCSRYSHGSGCTKKLNTIMHAPTIATTTVVVVVIVIMTSSLFFPSSL